MSFQECWRWRTSSTLLSSSVLPTTLRESRYPGASRKRSEHSGKIFSRKHLTRWGERRANTGREWSTLPSERSIRSHEWSGSNTNSFRGAVDRSRHERSWQYHVHASSAATNVTTPKRQEISIDFDGQRDFSFVPRNLCSDTFRSNRSDGRSGETRHGLNRSASPRLVLKCELADSYQLIS